MTPPVTTAIFDTLRIGSGWNPNAGVPDLTGSTIQGRMKSSSKPDGSWTSAFHSNMPYSAVTTWAEGSGWLDTQKNQADLVRRTVTTTRNDQIEVEEFIGTQRIAHSTRVHGGTGGEIIAAATNWEGNIPHTTFTAYYSELAGPSYAGRTKWIEKSDGTAATYSYAVAGPDLVVTARTGAGSRTGVTAGTEVVTTYSFGKVPIAQITKDIASNLVTERWDTDLSYNGGFDALGRTIKRIYNADVNDFDIRQYACCGLEYSRERDGSSTTYFRDGLKRVYKTESRASDNSPAVTTFTTVAGLTQESSRRVGTSALLFLGSSTTSIDGLTTTTTGPSEKSMLVADRPVTTSVRTHSAFGDTVTTTYADNSTAITSYYVDGQLKSKSGTAVPDVSYNYGTAITLGGEVLRLGVTEKITASGVTTFTQQDDLGRTVRTGLQGGGSFPMSVTDHEYYPTSASAGARGRLKSVTDSDGVKVSYGYNSEGERTTTSRTIPLSTGTATQVTTRIRSVVPNAVIRGSSLGVSLLETTSVSATGIPAVITLQSYAAINGLVSGSISFGRQTLVTATRPNAAGVATRNNTLPDGTKTFETWTHGLATSVQKKYIFGGIVTETSFGYDALQRLASVTDRRTGMTTYDLDADGLTDVTESGKLLAMRSPASHITSMSYDIMGQQTSTTLPDNSVTYTAYHPTGQVKATWGSSTHATWNSYDEQNRMTQLHTWKSGVALNPATIPATPPAGSAVTTLSYGAATGRLDRKQYADTKGTDYTYSSAGRLRTRVWARGITTTYGYTLGYLTSTDYSDTTPDVTTTFDALGRVSTVTQTNQSQLAYSYNPADLALDTETIRYDLDHNGTYEFSRLLDRSNDSLLRTTGFDLKNGTTVENRAIYSYSYVEGRLSTVKGGGDVALPQTFIYAYTSSSDLIRTVTSPVHTATITWEPNRDLLDIRENRFDTNVFSKYDYGVNNLGQRTEVATSSTLIPNLLNWQLGYDFFGQLNIADASVNTSDRRYEYDGIGNRMASADSTFRPISDNYTSNSLNQYTFVQLGSVGVSPAYDFDGNATAYPLPAAPTATSAMSWDAENRMTSSTVGTSTTTYLYDAQSRRIAKTTGATSILYVYDAWNCIAEYTGNNLSKTRLWGMDLSGSLQGAGGVGGLLSETINNQPSTLNYFPTYDGNGNISEYVASNGTVAAHFEYDPFGNTVVNTDTNNQFSYRFSTKPRDVETGLYYYGYRYYDPLTGRWPSRDPLEEEGGFNLYGFCFNLPMHAIDNLGGQVLLTPMYDPMIRGLLEPMTPRFIPRIVPRIIPPVEPGKIIPITPPSTPPTQITPPYSPIAGPYPILSPNPAPAPSPTPSPSSDAESEKSDPCCKPCNPNKGRIGWLKTHLTGEGHFNKWKELKGNGLYPVGEVPNPHMHVSKVNQTGYPDCECKWNEQQWVVPGSDHSGMPDANSPPTGGGPAK